MLPEAVPVSAADVHAIAARHGLGETDVRVLPSLGVINTVFALGDAFVLRVPRHHPAHIAQAHREAAAIPHAVAAGVRTPGLVAFDDRCDLLPVPYLVVEQVHGRDVESLGLPVDTLADAWFRVGEDLARLHGSTVPGDDTLHLAPEADQTGEPHSLVDARASDGWLSGNETGRLHGWIDRLEAALLEAARHECPNARLVHGDLQMANVLIDPATHGYVALVDWGCAFVGDPSIDFRVVPMGVLEPVLKGYRSTPGHDPAVTDAAVLHRKLQLDLWALPFGAHAGRSWGENAVPRLADLLLHLSLPASERWRALLDG